MSNEKGKLKLQPFDYASVQLKDSEYKRQFDEMLVYFLQIPDDDILLGFRRRAGMPHPGEELGGWYSNDGSFNPYDWDEIFNAFGQWLSLFGRAYRITGDQKVYEKAANLLSEWQKTIEDDGFFLYSNECNAFHYSYEKILGGLVDLYVYAGMEQAKDCLDCITGWAEKNLHRKRDPALAGHFTGGDPSVLETDNEWYTLSENLYRMYVASGDERYRDFALVWHYDYYWDGLRHGNADVMTGTHGYSHVNNLGGAAYAYRVWGDEKYLETMTMAYQIIKNNQLMASGGYAFNESMADPQGSNYRAVETVSRSFEVPCGSWAAFKLVRHLVSATGCAKYGAWAETILYNAIGASLPMKDDSQRRGKTFYYADYRVGGGRKVYFEHSFPCCSGTYPQAVAEYYNMIYYRSADGIYVTQYLPSVLETQINDCAVRVEIGGNYPQEDRFTVRVTGEGEFSVALRIPAWLKQDAEILLNGNRTEISCVPNQWAVIRKVWSGTEIISVRFPMQLWTSPIADGHPDRAALMYGPVMLAAKGKQHTVKGMVAQPETIAEKQEGLLFAAVNGQGQRIEFLPYWQFGEREWYTVYCDFKA